MKNTPKVGSMSNFWGAVQMAGCCCRCLLDAVESALFRIVFLRIALDEPLASGAVPCIAGQLVMLLPTVGLGIRDSALRILQIHAAARAVVRQRDVDGAQQEGGGCDRNDSTHRDSSCFIQ